VPGPDNDTIAEAIGITGADINFLAVHDHPGPKTEILVGVIDTGIDPEHEDLRDRMAANPGEIPDNGIDDDRNGFVDDVYGWDFSGSEESVPSEIVESEDVTDHIGHGTHLAGTIAATADNGVGIAGVAAHARVFGVKIFPNPYFSVSARAVYYAVTRGARVISMSWGGPFQSRALKEAIEYAHKRGVVLVASMGNSGAEDIYYPSSYPQTIAVGSSHSRDGLSQFSTCNDSIDLVAPGQQILSLRATGTDLYADVGEAGSYIVADNYLIASGTSMAAPHVSGAAAALLSIAPGLTNERVRQILRATAFDIRDPYDDGADLPGWDKFTGAGRIDLAAAIAALPGVHVVITEPLRDQWAGGELSVRGTATGPAFAGYEVRVTPGHNPQADDWVTVEMGSEPVIDGLLAQWNSDGRNGPHLIRLDAGPDARFDLPVNLVQNATASLGSPAEGDSIRLLATVVGSAAAPDFLSYRLEAVGPLPEQSVHFIAESVQPVWDDTLALWRTDSLIPGDYLLHLALETASDTTSDTVTVTVSNPFAPGWPVNLSALGHFAIRSVNLDGAGDEEIICPTAKGLWVFRSDGTVYPGWPRGVNTDWLTTPAVADLDHDGRYEIIIADESQMHVLAFIGEEYQGWPRPFAGTRSGIYGGSVPTVGNCDGRGDLEIAAIDRFGQIRVWNADGTDYSTTNGGGFGRLDATNSLGNALPSVAICDLDRDGSPELIAAGDEIHLFDGRTGSPHGDNVETRIAGHYSVNGIVVGDFDGNRVREIAYAYGDEAAAGTVISVNVIDLEGSSLPGWPRALPLTLDLNLLYSIAAGDVDGNHIPEIFVAPYSLGEGFLYAFHADGASVGSDSSNGLLAALPGTVSSIGLVDVDRDDESEIVLRIGQFFGGPDEVTVLESDGSVVPGYPLRYGSGSGIMPATPIIGDLNRDGLADMITLQSTDTVLAVWELGTPITLRARPWPQFRADHWNSNVVPTPRYDVVHLVRLINVVLSGALPMPPYEPSDIDCDGTVDLSDIIGLIDHLYRAGPAPCVP
jgi:hypothetical protein